MGYYKDRLTMTIIASLDQWHFRGTAVEGVISRSTSEQYKDGDKYIIMNVRFNHYRHAEGYWPDHWVLVSQTGDCFMLLDSQRLP